MILFSAAIFEYGSDAELHSEFVSVGAQGGGSWVADVPALLGGPAMLLDDNSGSSDKAARVVIGQPLTTMIVSGSAVWNSSATATRVLSTLDSAAAVQLEVRLDALGRFELYRGAGTTFLARGSRIYDRTVRHRIELLHTVADAGGVAELRVDRNVEIQFAGDTQATANADLQGVVFRSKSVPNGPTPKMWIKDILIQDTAAPNGGFLGDVRLKANVMSGDGSTQQWTPNNGGAHVAEIDDAAAHDGDVTHIASSTTGQVDLYTPAVLPADDEQIFDVIAWGWGEKSDAGAAPFNFRAKSGGSQSDGPAINPATSYALHRAGFAVDPATGLPWTRTAFNAAEFGVVRG